MYQRNLLLSVVFALLISCAQTPPKPSNASASAPAVPNAQPVKMVEAGPTHPGAQDITYNSHYPPIYPPQAIREKHYGTVVLLIKINADGELADIRIDQSSGFAELDASAIVAGSLRRL